MICNELPVSVQRVGERFIRLTPLFPLSAHVAFGLALDHSAERGNRGGGAHAREAENGLEGRVLRSKGLRPDF